MKTKAVITTVENMVYTIISLYEFEEGCTFKLLEDKLGEHYYFFPSIPYLNRLLASMIEKKLITVSKHKGRDTAKGIVRDRRYIRINREEDNPIINIVKMSQKKTESYIIY